MEAPPRRAFVGVVALLALVSLGVAAEPPAEDGAGAWLAALADDADKAAASAPPKPSAEFTKPIPLSFRVDYTLASDKVWRGVNWTEYAGEGREKPNHFLGTGVELATPVGTFGAAFWFAWFAGQDRLTPGCDDHFHEADYVAYWRRAFQEIATTVELGWIAYTFPQITGDWHDTYEVYVKLSFDDSKLFGTKSPVLNPYIYYGLDIDMGDYGSWIELGISHNFPLASFDALKNVAFLKDLTITPSLGLAIEHRYMDKFAGPGQEATRLAYIQYGLAVAYDVGKAIGLPRRYGDLNVVGYLNFNDAMREDLLNDELYGGVKLVYSW